jgi:ribonuclease HII
MKKKDFDTLIVEEYDSDDEYISTTNKDAKEEKVKEEKVKEEKVKEEKEEEGIEEGTKKVKNYVRVREISSLLKYYNEDDNTFEIGVDEAGRGPLFGRVYTAAVILPKDDSFDFSKMKDSKKFHSKKTIEKVANYIKENALAWYVSYESEKVIDEINILQATQKSFTTSILEIRKNVKKDMSAKNKIEDVDFKFHVLVDGNYFNPIVYKNNITNKMTNLNHVCIEGGDNKYCSIAAASILAKVERDKYIEELCIENPELIEKYAIDSNKGYGAKKHIDGIIEHGITIWHRRTFGICKKYV